MTCVVGQLLGPTAHCNEITAAPWAALISVGTCMVTCRNLQIKTFHSIVEIVIYCDIEYSFNTFIRSRTVLQRDSTCPPLRQIRCTIQHYMWNTSDKTPSKYYTNRKLSLILRDGTVTSECAKEKLLQMPAFATRAWRMQLWRPDVNHQNTPHWHTIKDVDAIKRHLMILNQNPKTLPRISSLHLGSWPP